MYQFAAILYQYFVNKDLDLPHFRTIIMMVFMFFIHLVQLGLVFKIPSDFIFFWNSTEPKIMQWMKAVLYFGVLYAAFYVLYRKSRLKKKVISEEAQRRWGIIIPVYITCSILLLGVLLIRSGIERGYIKW